MGRVLGLFAGQGELPQKIITHCYETSISLFLVAFEGQTDPALVDFHRNKNGTHIWTHFGAVGEILHYLKTNNVTHIVMAGGMRRPAWSDIKLDWKGTQWFAKMGLAKMGMGAAGDDGLLSQIEKLLEEEGFEVLSATDILNDLLASEGILGSYQPDEVDWHDIVRGREVARLLGAGDVGQAVVIQEGLVLGVEAIEGTESLLSRCAALRRQGRGGVLVKMAKPNQSRNTDLPTIGVDTIHQAKVAGLRGIAIEAGSTQILNKDAVIQAANAAGLYIIGIPAT